MCELALKLIEQNKRKHAAGEDATFLDLGNCGLTDELPEELFECVWLEGLNFGIEYPDFEKNDDVYSPNKGDSNNLSNLAIASLSRLENIKALFLRYSQISDVSPLSAITALNTLDLSYNQISDLSPLSTIATLNTLNLSYNQIVDLSPLSAIAALNTLDLSRNQISDLSPLSIIANLNTLKLNHNQISDLLPLSTIAALNKLDLSFNQIVDLSPLSAIATLNTLELGGNQISDLSSLSTIAALNKLDLGGNQISDLSPLSTIAALNTLKLGGNQISDLSPLSAITTLKTLDLRYNQISDLSPLSVIAALNELRLSRNQISDLTPLSAIATLNELDLRGNQISDLTPLSAVAALNTLKLGGNQISDLSPLSAVTTLKTLDLRYNQISDLSPLSVIGALNELRLSRNQISEFDYLLLGDWPLLEVLNLSGMEIRNIPSAISELDNCAAALADYIKGIEKEPVPVYESKLILIGNGRVGKTCLLKRMLDNTFDANEPSTHAIQLREWPLNDLAEENSLDDILLNIWDFGGQDIYHATHRMFMQTDALFLLAWDAVTEKTPAQTEVLYNGKTISYTNHPIGYWLSYIKVLSSNSSVILTQTMMDSAPDADAGLSKAELKKFNVMYNLAVESSRKTANGFESLKEKISQVVLQRINDVCTTLPAQWYRVRQAIAKMQKANITCITIDEFRALCVQQELDDSSTKTLLEYLHNTGVVFYKKGLFGNQLIIDQKWAIDAVYAIFDRKGSFTKWHDKGLFSGEDLQDIWKGEYSMAEQQLFLDFMLRCEICFEVDYKHYKPFIERKFIAPQLLPENKSTETREGIESAFHNNNSIYMMCRHSFLHEAVIQRFIVRTSFIASNREMWQHGVLLRSADGVALVEADTAKNEIMVRVKDGNKALTSKIDNELDEITKNESGIETFYSFDGENFVSIEKLQAHPVDNPKIQAENGAWLPFHQFRGFLNKNENLRFERPELLKPEVTNKPQIFFSYAWNEPSEKIVTELYDSLKKDNYPVIMDKVDLPYKKSISEFMENIGKGEFVVVAISDKYLRSNNCMYELYELYRNSKLQTDELLTKIFPIRVDSLNLDDAEVLQAYFDHWKQREEQFRKLKNEHDYSQEKYLRIKNIANSLGELLPFLNDINASTKEVLSADNFAEIKKAIKDRL